jgi:hypothetical protein
MKKKLKKKIQNSIIDQYLKKEQLFLTETSFKQKENNTFSRSIKISKSTTKFLKNSSILQKRSNSSIYFKSFNNYNNLNKYIQENKNNNCLNIIKNKNFYFAISENEKYLPNFFD